MLQAKVCNAPRDLKYTLTRLPSAKSSRVTLFDNTLSEMFGRNNQSYRKPMICHPAAFAKLHFVQHDKDAAILQSK